MVVIKFKDGQKCSYDGYRATLLDGLKEAVKNHNTSIVGLYDGKSGKGKTTISIHDAFYCNEKDVNLYYNPESFLKGLAEAKPESVHIFDEAMIISNRSSLTEVNRMIIQAMSMIRSKRIYVFFNVNSIFDLDRNLVLSRADYLIHLYSDGLLDRGKFCAFFKSSGDKRDRLKELYIYGKKDYSYSKPKANFYGAFPKTFLINEKKYEKDKQEAINEFLTQTEGKSSYKYRNVAIRFVKYLKKKGMNPDEIAEISELSKRTIYTLLSVD